MNLTINEQLMNDTKDANICIFIANLAHWLRTNASKLELPLEQRNFRQGRYWSYNSLEGFVKFFGFWSTRNIRTIIKNCIAQGLIETSTFNKKKYDNTLWYTLTDKGLEYYPPIRDMFLNTLVDSDKQLVETDNAIPEDLNYSNSINHRITKEKKNSVQKFSIKDMQADNPHDIPDEWLDEWITKRGKNKITRLVWCTLNENLTELQKLGIIPLQAFKRMATAGWRSLEVSYFEQELKRKKQNVEDVPQLTVNDIYRPWPIS